jgi:hypothetical protein
MGDRVDECILTRSVDRAGREVVELLDDGSVREGLEDRASGEL